MKKSEAVESLERSGHEINDLYARAWSTALYPTQHGWLKSIASAAMIPVLSTAAIGQMVTSAVAQQLPENVYDTVSNLGKRDAP